MKRILLLLFIITLLCCKSNAIIAQADSDSSLVSEPVKVKLKRNGKYQLLVNNEPFYIKGAGLEFGKIPTVAKHDGNSFRTWRTENGKQSGKEVLDEAHKNGLMVTMGIEVARERHGFDYNDDNCC